MNEEHFLSVDYLILQVPKYLIDIYNAQADNEIVTSNLNLPGRHTRTANTVRTFYHLRK